MILQTQCPKPRNLDALSSFCFKKNRAWFNLVCAIGFTTLILPGSVPVNQVDTYFTIVHSPNLWWLKFPCSTWISSMLCASVAGRLQPSLPGPRRSATCGAHWAGRAQSLEGAAIPQWQPARVHQAAWGHMVMVTILVIIVVILIFMIMFLFYDHYHCYLLL